MENLDFIAELKFLPSKEGGRETSAKSGYRPHIEFENYPEYLTSGHQDINNTLIKKKCFLGKGGKHK